MWREVPDCHRFDVDKHQIGRERSAMKAMSEDGGARYDERTVVVSDSVPVKIRGLKKESVRISCPDVMLWRSMSCDNSPN